MPVHSYLSRHLRVKCYPLLPGPIIGTLFTSVRSANFSAISFLFPILLQQTFFVIVCHTSFYKFLSTPTVGLAESPYSKFLKAAPPYQPMLRRNKLHPKWPPARTSARLRQKPRDPTGHGRSQDFVVGGRPLRGVVLGRGVTPLLFQIIGLGCAVSSPVGSEKSPDANAFSYI